MKMSEIISDDIISKDKRKPSEWVKPRTKPVSQDYFGNRKTPKSPDREVQEKPKQKEWFEESISDHTMTLLKILKDNDMDALSKFVDTHPELSDDLTYKTAQRILKSVKSHDNDLEKYRHSISESSMASATRKPQGSKFGGYYKGTQKGAPKPGQSFGSACESKDEDEEDIPPPENAKKTQIAGTLGTYKKANDFFDLLDKENEKPHTHKVPKKIKTLDFGAGKGHGTPHLGKDAESYEPYPSEDFKPHFIEVSKIPSNRYHRIVNLNVLNVVPNTKRRRDRDEIVKNIGRVLAPGGFAIVTTRGRDVLTIKGRPGKEEMSMISSIGTYQKGFTQKELREYIQKVLGENFEVRSIKLGPAGVIIKKLRKDKHIEEESTEGPLGMMGEVAPPGKEKLVRSLKKEYPGHPEKAFATAWAIKNGTVNHKGKK